MSTSRTRTPRRIGGMARAQTTAFGDRLDAVRAATVQLAAPLSAEDCALQSMPDASPVKWHLAHTTWFFETFVLERSIRGYRHFDPRYRVLFNSYYNAVGDKHPRPDRGLLSRPTLDEVHSYRRHVERPSGPARCASRRRRGTRVAAGTRPAARTATSGAYPHRPEAPAVTQSAATRVHGALAADAGQTAPLALDWLRRRNGHRRPPRRRLLLRQRAATTPGLPHSV